MTANPLEFSQFAAGVGPGPEGRTQNAQAARLRGRTYPSIPSRRRGEGKRVAWYLGMAAAALSPLLPVLPDTTIGSPRAILTAVIAGLLSASLVARGAK